MVRLSTFPTKSAGPAKVTGPLQQALVRVVLGNPRTSTPCIEWAQSAPDATTTWIECSSSGRNNSSTTGGKSAACVAVPSSSDVLGSWMDFWCTKLDDFHLNFSVFTTPTDSSHEPRTTFARACILGVELRELFGVLRRPLLVADGRLVGLLTVDFLVVKPFATPLEAYNFNTAWKGACSMREKELSISWFTGHRGMGKTKAHLPRENTEHSFIESTRSKYVDMIELDVQMTKDGYPVVYHDWFFRPSGRDKDAERSHLEVPPYRLTLREFQSLYASGARKEAHREASRQALAQVSSDSAAVDELANDRVRTLAEVCRALPVDIGIMVEVKYPAPSVQQDDQIVYPERNELIDRILHDLYSVASNARRTIIFLSFEADICQMLALKQRTFPVFFSHCAARDRPCEMHDPRCVSVKQGVDFAAAQGMQGMVYWEDVLRTDADAVSMAHSRGMQVVTYGSGNMNPEWVRDQIDMGVDGVIADEAPSVAEKTKPLLGARAEEKCGNGKKALEGGIEQLVGDTNEVEFVEYQLF